MKARVAENRSRVVLAEAEVPLAMADAFRASAILGKDVTGVADLEGEDNTLMLDFFEIVLGSQWETASAKVRDGGLLMDEMRWTAEELMQRYGLDGGNEAVVVEKVDGDPSGDNPPS